ncbi:MAG: hypothetical protein ACFB9M_11705 [Myxococcota bacterium]
MGAVGSLSGCADEVLGIPPEARGPGQLVFPLGIEGLTDPSGSFLFVSSTNHNQAFTSGTINAYDRLVLARTVGTTTNFVDGSLISDPELDLRLNEDGTAVIGAGACRQQIVEPTIQSSFETPEPLDLTAAFLMSIRTPSSGGRMRLIDGRLVFPTRFNQLLVFFDLNPGGALAEFGTIPGPGSLISCLLEGEAPEPGIDCSSRFLLLLGEDDPFEVARVLDPSTGLEFLAVSHLEPPTGSGAGVSMVPVSRIEARLSGGPLDPTLPVVARVLGLQGGTGIEFAGSLAPEMEDTLFLGSTFPISGISQLAALSTTDLAAARRNPFIQEGPLDTNDVDFDPSTVIPTANVNLTGLSAASSVEGVVFAPAADGLPNRIYATVRIPEQIDSDNSAIIVLSFVDDRLQIESLLEVGEELGPPVLSPFSAPGQRWLYIPDVRGDRLYIVDVSTDRPLVLNELRGRFTLDTPTGSLSTFTLASPFGLFFDEQSFTVNGSSFLRRLLYVTNFENSTLAVVDVTDANPAVHCLVARLGSVFDATTDPEEDTL